MNFVIPTKAEIQPVHGREAPKDASLCANCEVFLCAVDTAGWILFFNGVMTVEVESDMCRRRTTGIHKVRHVRA